MHTLERSIDEVRERYGVRGEVQTVGERRRRVGVRHGDAMSTEDQVG